MLGDIRIALRGLRRRPTFFTTAALTIALGIGATAAIYSFVDAVLVRPLPYENADELVTFDVKGVEGNLISLSIPNYRDWRNRNRSFASVSAAAGWSMLETNAAPASVLNISIVMGPLFETLGLRAGTGRVFSPAEAEPGSEPLVVLGHGYWQRRFGGDPSVVGRAIVLDNRPHTIVGVLSPGTGWPSSRTEAYVNMGSIPGLPFDLRSSSFGTRAIARLRPGVRIEQAVDDMDRVFREVRETVGDDVAQPIVRPLHDWFAGSARQPLLALLASVSFLLLIAIVNVANLQLGRGEEVRREMALRTALGATRTALVRLRVIESLILAMVGGAAGVAIAYAAIRALIPMVPRSAPPTLVERIGLSPGVLLFCLLVTTLAGLVIGLAPAWQASSVKPGDELMSGSRSVTRQRPVISLLVSGELALALMLLIGSGLAMRSLVNLKAEDVGFVADGVLSARLRLPSGRYADPERYVQMQERVLAEVNAIPGVRRSALTLLIPLSERSWELRAYPEGGTLRDNAEHTLFNMVTADYFATLGVPILQGRAFTAGDRADTPPVVIVDEAMAARLWPGQNPIGKRLSIEERRDGPDSTAALFREVVGISRNVRHYAVAAASRPQAYVPSTQARGRSGAGLSVALRTSGDPTALTRSLQDAIGRVDPNMALSDIRPLTTYVDDNLGNSRLLGWLLTVFSAVALGLAAVGVFGMIAYSVSRRTREWGVRLALGAVPRELIRGIVWRGLGLAAMGVAVGLTGAVLLSRLMSSLLYGVRAVDPLTYAGLSLILLAVAAVAAWLPSRRVARIDAARVLGTD